MESIVSLKSACNIKILFTFDNTHGFYQMMLAHLQYHYEPKHIIWILDRRPASHQQLRELNMMDIHVSPVNIILLHIKCGRVCVTNLSLFHSFIFLSCTLWLTCLPGRLDAKLPVCYAPILGKEKSLTLVVLNAPTKMYSIYDVTECYQMVNFISIWCTHT